MLILIMIITLEIVTVMNMKINTINVVSNLYYPINPSMNHFDLINSISVTLKNSPLTWTLFHVLGHRDNAVKERVN